MTHPIMIYDWWSESGWRLEVTMHVLCYNCWDSSEMLTFLIRFYDPKPMFWKKVLRINVCEIIKSLKNNCMVDYCRHVVGMPWEWYRLRHSNTLSSETTYFKQLIMLHLIIEQFNYYFIFYFISQNLLIYQVYTH